MVISRQGFTNPYLRCKNKTFSLNLQQTEKTQNKKYLLCPQNLSTIRNLSP